MMMTAAQQENSWDLTQPWSWDSSYLIDDTKDRPEWTGLDWIGPRASRVCVRASGCLSIQWICF